MRSYTEATFSLLDVDSGKDLAPLVSSSKHPSSFLGGGGRGSWGTGVGASAPASAVARGSSFGGGVAVAGDSMLTDRKRLRSALDTLPNPSETEDQLQELRLLRQRDAESHAVERSNLTSKVEKLERQLKFMEAEEDALRKKATEKETSFVAERLSMEEAATKLRQTVRSLRDENTELKNSLDDATTMCQWLQKQVDSKALAVDDSRSALRTQLERLQRELTEASAKASQVPLLEEQLAQLRADTASIRGGSTEDASALSREITQLREQLSLSSRHERAAKEELGELKSQQRKVAMLEAQLATAQEKAAHNEESMRQVAVLQVKVDELMQERTRVIDAVRQVATRADASSSSRSLEKDVLEFIRFLQDAKLQLLNEKGQVETKLAVATRAGDVAERHAQQLEGQLLTLKQEHHELRSANMRLQSRCSELEKGVAGLRHVTSTYEAEEKMLTERAGSTPGPAVLTTPSKGKEAMVTYLEASLKTANDRIAALEAEAATMTASSIVAELRAKLDATVTQLEVKTKEAAKMTALVEKLESENAKLTNQVARGDFNPATTKVLRLAWNPLDAKKVETEEDLAAKVTILEDEVKRLRTQLFTVTSAGGAAPGTEVGASSSATGPPAVATPSAAGIAPSGMVPEADVEKKLQRFKEIFKKKVATFKEAVYLLTGYKLDLRENGASRPTDIELKSVYAESSEDCIRFQLIDGRLDLIETEFVKGLSGSILPYLTTFHSIPAFLATVTLDLFGRTTQAM